MWNIKEGYCLKFERTYKDKIPNQLAKAKYCNFWPSAGISFAISLWIIGKNEGQFLSSVEIPCGMPIQSKQFNRTLKDEDRKEK